MNPEELNVLTQQLGEIGTQIDDKKQARSDLLRQRFDLKEQRRYYRAQLRAAEAEERKEKVAAKLADIEQEVAALDEKIDALEKEIETLGDRADDISVEIGKAAGEAEPVDFEPLEDEDPDWGEAFGKTMDSFNELLRKGLKKAADTLEKVDLDKVSDSVETYAAKAAKTAKVAAEKVGAAWNEAAENRQKPGGIGDHHISGTGVMDGGCYNHISVSGGCKVSSDLVCREIKVSGSFRAHGNVDCSGDITVSGGFVGEKNVKAENITGTGTVKVMGDLEAGKIQIPGGLTVEGDISARELKVTGSLKANGDVEADSFTASGLVNVGGIINADEVTIKLDVSQSAVGSIGGSKVTVTQGSASGILSQFLKNVGKLTTESIEGDELELHNVEAKVVRGSSVIIHSGCKIDRVEYSKYCSIDETSLVGECVKV